MDLEVVGGLSESRLGMVAWWCCVACWLWWCVCTHAGGWLVEVGARVSADWLVVWQQQGHG
jgi:hypothetical protein